MENYKRCSIICSRQAGFADKTLVLEVSVLVFSVLTKVRSVSVGWARNVLVTLEKTSFTSVSDVKCCNWWAKFTMSLWHTEYACATVSCCMAIVVSQRLDVLTWSRAAHVSRIRRVDGATMEATQGLGLVLTEEGMVRALERMHCWSTELIGVLWNDGTSRCVHVSVVTKFFYTIAKSTSHSVSIPRILLSSLAAERHTGFC